MRRLPLLLAVAVLAATACRTGSSSTAGGPSRVVAAEDFWGSIARELGGEKASVTSLITNPDTDPHDYEPSSADARRMAAADLVVVNGIGYDPWTGKLLAANPVSRRAVVNVGAVAGLKEGDNPHQWYSPAAVERVADAI